jgi:hypothetical protein
MKKTATNRNRKNSRKIPSPGRPLEVDELTEHVAERYNTHRNGPFGDKNRSRGISTHAEQAKYLKELNSRPALVLNADYQVRIFQVELLCPCVLESKYWQTSAVLNSFFSSILNQPLSYLPLSLWSWQDAVKSVFSGKVTVVDVYPDVTIRAVNLEIPLPSVIALNDYVKQANQRPAFTRRNVFLRDEYKCQYCNERFHTADLTLDHVKARSMGGILSWWV